MILGYGSEYLNQSNRWLKYLNEGVYPYYILHQTLLILMAYWLADYSLGGFTESLIVILTTIIGCGLGFEVIRRFKVLRLLFGLKITGNKPASTVNQ
jgi:surface polysaccharide O-acyltransferase-like enzyme